MADKKNTVLVRALASTGRLHYGQIGEVELNESNQGKIDAGLLEVLPDQDIGGYAVIEPTTTSTVASPTTQADASAASGEYNPADYNVDEVLDHLAKHPDQRDAVIKAEKAGKARRGILDA